jgi:hypothetical protein
MRGTLDLGLHYLILSIGDRLLGMFKKAAVILGPNRIAMLIVGILWAKRGTAQEFVAKAYRLDVGALSKRWREIRAVVRSECEDHGEKERATTQHNSGAQKERTSHLIPHNRSLNCR